MRFLEKLGRWFDDRLQLAKPIQATMAHPVPRQTASWFYVFGSAALTVFALQLVTGILLAFVYVPSAGEAWNSLQTLNQHITAGWFIRALHGWGSNFMVAIVLIHMVQVFFFGAYKFPRELTWIIGVVLLLVTLGMAFTGQVLRFDQDAYWGLGIGSSIASRIPFVGPALVSLLLGGPIIAASTLSRFFALHVFVVPGLLIGFVALHLILVINVGINEWPMPGRVVRRATYLKEYHELLQKDGVRFVPDAFRKDLVFSGLIILALVACATFLGPFGPKGQPDPTVVQAVPRPDYFFLWMYAALALLPPKMETILLLAAFTELGTYAPWSPAMDAWSSAPVPPKLIEGRSALERQGALVFQAKQCRNCHALDGGGGLRGPALDAVATRLTADQLIRQVLQGRGNMPAYGKSLRPAEVTALVAFLSTLHPTGQAPARDASLPVALETSGEISASTRP